jgi:hypothetical protein
MIIPADEVTQAAALRTTAIAEAAARIVTDEMVAPYAGR